MVRTNLRHGVKKWSAIRARKEKLSNVTVIIGTGKTLDCVLFSCIQFQGHILEYNES